MVAAFFGIPENSKGLLVPKYIDASIFRVLQSIWRIYQMSVTFKIATIDVFNTQFTVILKPKDASNFLFFLRNTLQRDDLDEAMVFRWCISHGIPVKMKYKARSDYSLLENIQGCFFYLSFRKWVRKNCPCSRNRDGYMVAAETEAEHG